MKNHADAMIFHTAICVAGAINSYMREAGFEIQPAGFSGAKRLWNGDYYEN